MTTPEQTVEPQIPLDEQSRFGWTHPVQVPGTETYVDLHKAGTVALALTSTLIATGIYSASNRSSDEGLTPQWHTTHTRTYTTSASRQEDGSSTSTESHTVIAPAPPQQLSFKVSAANMPDVTSFDLATTPESQVIIGQKSFSDFIGNVVSEVKQGWQISGITVNGMASDETRLDKRAGLGELDTKNIGLAKQYGAFVRQAVHHSLQDQGVDVPASAFSGEPEEDILDADQLAEIESAREREGLADNLALIDAYKTHPENLKQSTKDLLHSLLDVNRGANVIVNLSSPAGKTVTTTYETTTQRCLNVTTINETTQKDISHPNHKLPIMIVPLPVVRMRRSRRDEIIEEPLEHQPSVSSVATPPVSPERDDLDRDVDTHYGSLFRRDDKGFRPSRSGARLARREIDAVRSDAESARLAERFGYSFRSNTPSRYELSRQQRLERLRARMGADDLDGLDLLLAREESSRLRRALSITALSALGIAAIPFVVKGDVGYCPAPEQHRKQDWKWSQMFNYLDVRLHIPLTNIDSGRLPLMDDPCLPQTAPSPATPHGPTSTTLPSCDSRVIEIKDGKVEYDSGETHYPSATKVTTRTVTQ